MDTAQAPDRSKRAPTFGLRAVFAGIGRLLLLADRPEAGLIETSTVRGGSADPHRRTGQRPVRPGRGPAEPTSRWRSLDKTGNVRLLSAEDLDDEFDDVEFLVAEFLGEEPPDGVVADDVIVADQILDTELPDAELPDGELPDVELPRVELPERELGGATVPALPLANYDDLSLASIRARLRTLDAGQLRILADYERRNAERPEVLGMLERRIEKLGAGG